MARRLPRITRSWLKRQDACAEGIRLFEAAFGADARVEPTRENLRAAAAAGLDLYWLGSRIDARETLDARKQIALQRRFSAARRSVRRIVARVTKQNDAKSPRLIDEIRAGLLYLVRAETESESRILAGQIGRLVADIASRHEKGLRRHGAALRLHQTRAADAMADMLGLP